MTQPRHFLVVGSNRGLGLEFTRQWLEAGHRVFSLARVPETSPGLRVLRERFPETLSSHPCDVTDEDSIQGARKSVEKACDHLDVILNNAGVRGSDGDSLQGLDPAELHNVFDVNTLGPIRIARAFLPLLRQGEKPRIVQITSLMGSLEDNRSGGSWAYRISKAALNMANRNLALELVPTGIPSVVLHPGWVQTDMGGRNAPLTIEESVTAMAETIDSLTMKQTGSFLDREGRSLPW